MAGGGLWFVIDIPTEEYELHRYSRSGITIVTKENEIKPPDVFGTKNGRTTEVTTAVKGNNFHPNEESLEKVVQKILEELKINDARWTLDKTGNFYQVSFPCLPGLRCDVILTSLTTKGIGMCRGSSLGILPCSVLCQDEDIQENQEEMLTLMSDDIKKSESDSTLSKTKSDIKRAFKSFKEMQKKFLKTVTARLTVAQVVEGVRAGAEMTFDFIMLAIVASMISALGLLENSSVVIVASMLISPIMGPILAGTFGAVIRDRSLRNLGIKTEVVGLWICVGFGFVFGLVGASLNIYWGHQEWPTAEMTSRGLGRSLWVGILIAIPSGAGVALSVLGGNVGSLVGVAISASLLPPAVNAGLLWGIASILTMKAQDEEPQMFQMNGITQFMQPSLVPPLKYHVSYYNEMDKECAMLGLISLVLTLINIVCIVLAAVVVLKIKEVAPRTSVSKTTRFWREDLKIARTYNTSMPPAEAEDLGKQFLAEWASLNGLEPADVLSDDAEARITQIETLKDIIQDVEADEVFQTVAKSVSRPDSQTLSQRLSVMSFHPVAGPSSHHPPPPYDVESGLQDEERNDQEHRARRTGLSSWDTGGAAAAQESLPDGSTDPDLQHVELRRQPPPPLAITSRASRAPSRTSAILRQSLLNSDNRYSLWPSQRVTAKPRFLVTPVPEIVPPTRSRLSRFLYELPVLKETSC